jgi:hypothetical protein
MIYAKTNPIGLDALISKIQSKLYTDLNELWSTELEAFERCYIIQDKEGKKNVQRFVKKNEYQTISVAEKNKFFFLHKAKSTKEDALYYTSEMEVIFILDLFNLKSEIEHRADFEVQSDVESILTQFDNVWIISLESGFDKALSGISYVQENDMQPYHVFKFNLGVRYKLDDTCCC